MKANEKQEFAAKEKTIVHRVAQKAYQFCNSKQSWGKMGPANHQQKPSSLPDEENWKETKKM